MLTFAGDGLDGNGLQLEKVGQFFQVLPVYFGEFAKNGFLVCFSLEKSVNIFPKVRYEQFHVRERGSTLKILSIALFKIQQNLHDCAPLKTTVLCSKRRKNELNFFVFTVTVKLLKYKSVMLDNCAVTVVQQMVHYRKILARNIFFINFMTVRVTRYQGL